MYTYNVCVYCLFVCLLFVVGCYCVYVVDLAEHVARASVGTCVGSGFKRNVIASCVCVTSAVCRVVLRNISYFDPPINTQPTQVPNQRSRRRVTPEVLALSSLSSLL